MRRARKGLLAAVIFALAAGAITPATGAPGRVQRLSEARNGGGANGDTPARSVPDTTSPDISLDGTVVAFSSDASNLVPGDTNGVADVFIRDMATGRIERVSLTRSGAQANGPSYSPALSVHGRWLAFVSSASNLVPGDTNGVADVFLLDRKRDRLRRISVSSRGRQANGPSNTPFVSLFGDWVTFESAASNLDRRDDNDMPDAFLHVRRKKRTWRIAPPKIDRDDADDLVAWTERPTISWRGEAMAFVRKAKRIRPDLPGAPDTPGIPQPPSVPGPEVPAIHLPSEPPDEPLLSDVFIKDRDHRTMTQVAVPKWDVYRILSDEPLLSADGRRVVFQGSSILDAQAVSRRVGLPPELNVRDDSLVRNPVDPVDIYVYDRVSDTVFPASRNPYGLPADGPAYAAKISSEGHMVTFTSEATNLVPGDDNGVADVFIWDSRERALSRLSARPDGSSSNGASIAASLSYDGRHIVFASNATNLVDGDTNARMDVFHHDRRTDTTNHVPNLKPLKGVRTISPGIEYAIDLRVKDEDDDPITFDTIVIIPPATKLPGPGGLAVSAWPTGDLPPGMSLDKRTGAFRWTPTPNQAGPWTIGFWVGDPRGASDVEALQVVVRSATDMAICAIERAC